MLKKRSRGVAKPSPMSQAEVREMCSRHAVVPLWPDAGRAFGYSEDHTRRMAQAGQFPGAFQSGRKWSVATAPIAKVLGI